jgi:V-type H+-transporting ATPase subunit G
LKEAKLEAEKEIESYKLEKEEEFKKKFAEDSSASQDTATKLAQQADADVAAVKTHVSAKQQQVLDLLLKYVTSS